MNHDRISRWEQRILSRPALCFAVYAAWLCIERFILGSSSYLESHDIGDSMIARNLAVARDLLRFGPSYWMPSVIGGVDRLAQTHSYLNPSTLFHILLPGWAAYPSLLAINVFLSSYFTFRLCRDDLDLGPWPALYAGAAAVCVQSNELLIAQWGVATLPMMIWAFNRIDTRPQSRWSLTLLLGLFHSFASAIATTIPFSLSLLAAWFALIQPRASVRFWLRFLFFCAATITLHIQVTHALLANLAASQRGMVTLVAPLTREMVPRLIWDGILSLAQYPLSTALLIAGLAIARGGDRRMKTTALLLLFTAAGSTLLKHAIGLLPPELSMFRSFQASRYSLQTYFFAALCGAQGLQILASRYGEVGRRWGAITVLFILASSLPDKLMTGRSWLLEGSYAANYESRVLRSVLPAGGKPYRVVSILHGLYPFYANAHGFDTADGEGNIYPRRYNRFWARVIEPSASLRPALASQLDVFLNIGTRVQLSLDTVEHDPDGLPFDRYYRPALLSLLNVRYIISRHPVSGSQLVPLLTQAPWNSMTRIQRLFLRMRENFLGKSYLYVYENTSVLPRYFVAAKTRYFDDEDSLLNAAARAEVATLKSTVFLTREHAALFPASHALTRGRADVISNTPDRIELALESNGPGALVGTNNFSPFWNCAVDGRKRPIVPGYGTFWTVPVNRGDKRAVFTYEPPYSLRRAGRW